MIIALLRDFRILCNQKDIKLTIYLTPPLSFFANGPKITIGIVCSYIFTRVNHKSRGVKTLDVATRRNRSGPICYVGRLLAVVSGPL